MNLMKYRAAQAISTANLVSKYNKQNLRRVLMYHSVVKNTESTFQKSDIYSISESYFTSHIEYLARQFNSVDRRVVSLEDSSSSGVSVTFDDGYKDTLTIAAPLLCKNNLPFHVFVTPANVISGENRYLSEAELVSLSKLPGVTIGAHGFSHQHLNTLQATEITDELKSSKDWLENLTQKNITTMSYPHGAFNSQVQEIAASVGYLYAATSRWGCYQVGLKPLESPRIDVWNLDNQTTLKQKLNGQWDWIGKLLSPLQATIR